MRFRELLLEYRRDITARNYGAKLLDALLHDQLLNIYDTLAQALPDEMDPAIDAAHEMAEQQSKNSAYAQLIRDNAQTIIDYMLSRFEDADPTPNKRYTEWLARTYANSRRYDRRQFLFEDVVSIVADYLRKFIEYSNRGLLQSPYNDINRYKTFSDFMNAIDRITESIKTDRDKYANELYRLTMNPDNNWFVDKHRAVIAPTGEVDPKLLVDSVVKWIEALDPTPNKKYTGWLIREYATGSMPRLEDIEFLSPLLRTYDRIKQRPDFPFERDILKIDSSQLFEILNWWDEIKPKKRLTDRGRSVEIDNNVEYRAIMPQNEEASCYYGQSTRWCTAATESSNYFAQYNERSPLLILLPKKPQYEKEKYQLHFAISISAIGGHYTTELTNQEKLEQAVEADPNQWQIRWGEFSNDKNQNVGLRGIFARFGKETVMNTLQRFGEEGGPQLQWQISAILDMYSGRYRGLY